MVTVAVAVVERRVDVNTFGHLVSRGVGCLLAVAIWECERSRICENIGIAVCDVCWPLLHWLVEQLVVARGWSTAWA